MVEFAEPEEFVVISEFMVLHFEGVDVDEETELLEVAADGGVAEFEFVAGDGGFAVGGLAGDAGFAVGGLAVPDVGNGLGQL